MSPAIAAIVSRHSLRDALIASFHAARRCVNAHGEVILNDACHAGMLLALVGCPRTALALESGTDVHGQAVRGHLRAVWLEELQDARDGVAREERRQMVTISDEEPESR